VRFASCLIRRGKAKPISDKLWPLIVAHVLLDIVGLLFGLQDS